MRTPIAPGPWRVKVDEKISATLIYASDRSGMPVCRILRASHGDGNARLIAAAPELLFDLKLALMHFEACPAHTAPAIAEAIRKTIAKAEGR